ncbi:MAG TPA: signal peptidase I [Clostridia bacterium]|jgi:signal peptidase I|nr:MAG: Signal peptidase IB [Firmicutes bacterium ADurb.Bin146]HOD93672.1 signal peptidase I [Clostridia bacterium]
MNKSNEYDNQKEFEDFIQNDDFTLESLYHDIDEKKKKKHKSREILLWIRSFIFVIVFVTIFRGFIGEPVKVYGPSMENTLKTNDVLIMSKISLNIEGVKKNDIVVIEIEPVQFKILTFMNNIVWLRRLFPTTDREDYIKRVIALEGEEINLINGIVYIDGKKLDEPYLKDYASTFERLIDMPYTVPKGYVFVLGDNRLVSKDSRSIGAISIDSIIGKVIFRTWPITKIGTLN